MAASRILLVDADDAAAQVIAQTLTAAGHQVTTIADGDEAFHHAGASELIVIDLPGGKRTAADLCREIRATPALAAVPVLCIAQTDDVEARIAFLEVGADDVVAKPFDGRELEARVEALVLRFQRSRELAPVAAAAAAGTPVRRLATVFSPKGGVGTTTIATNLAVVLAQRAPGTVVIVDLDLQFGQVATQLDLEPSLTLTDALRDDTALAEPELLRTYTLRHESGLHVLAAPGDPTRAGQVRADQVSRVLETLLGTFAHIVVDAGSRLDAISTTAIEHADQVILPVVPEVPALKAVHRLLDHLTESGAIVTKTVFVLNTVFAKELVRQKDVETALGARVAARLPYDPFLYLKAVNEGVPVVIGAPHTPPAEGMVALAGIVFPDDAPRPETKREERPRGLGSLLRRG